jgi:hypothetical protein
MMFCTNCGEPREDNATVCAKCGRRVQQFPPPPSIPNYLVQSILVTLCCCLPFGVVSIVYAAQVNGKLAGGDIAGAQAASRNAKMWAWIAFGSGVLISLISMGVNFFDAIKR